MRSSIIEKFIGEITQGKKDHFERFYEIFSARGFSLELESNSGKVWLSNDSHREDGEFLEALQDTNYKKKYNKPHQDAIDECDNRGNHRNRHSYFDYIGTQLFDINNNQYLYELFTHEIPVDLFRLNWERDRYGRFEQFKRCERLPAIRVYDLEPFIARLVKSISTIGISTWSSCEGHWGKPAYIVFDGRYHRTWFQTIFHKFIQKKLNLSCRWDWMGWDERCIVSSPDGNILEMYLEIQDVARLIYDCKIFLRSMKRHVCSLLTAQHKNMDLKGLLRLFEDYFEKSMDKIN